MRVIYPLALTLALYGTNVNAHDQWANGKEVPKWVKEACCGPNDVHHLRPDQVEQVTCKDGGVCFKVDGYKELIPYSRTQPSQDGDYWIFYRDGGNMCSPEGGCSIVDQSQVYCFFVPESG